MALGTVALADRRILGNRNPNTAAIPANRFLAIEGVSLVERPRAKLFFRVGAAGTHTTIVVTVEASFDGAAWYGLQFGSPLTQGQLLVPFTIDANGITVPVAVGLAGVVLEVPGGVSYYRVGLAGDGADGNGDVGLLLTRE